MAFQSARKKGDNIWLDKEEQVEPENGSRKTTFSSEPEMDTVEPLGLISIS